MDEETIILHGIKYRKFIRHPEPVRDGTLRCISCGQIHCDDDLEDGRKIHDNRFCPACPEYHAARKQPT